MSNNTPDMNKILDRVVKLLKLASNNPNAEEAASAAAKAQEIMTQHNLDMGSIERKSGATDEKREKEAVEGSFYKYNHDLYAAVAKLNFCMHWITKEMIQSQLPPKNSNDRREWKSQGCPENFRILRPVHKLIGRKVNVAMTKVMVGYLDQAIERLLREWMAEYNYDSTMLFSRKAMNFREGAVANLIDRIQEERDRVDLERQKKAKEEERRAAHPASAPSTGTALVLADYAASEEAGNYDARYGEGAWARRQARQVVDPDAMAKYYAKIEREERYEAEGMECLAIFHPKLYARIIEKAAKEKAKEEESNRKYWERQDRKEEREAAKRDHGAFNAGHARAEKISLNQQVGYDPLKQVK